MSGIMQLLLSGRPQVASDPYFEYTTLLLPGNGTNGAQNNTFLDSSTNNFTITRNGNTTQGTFSPFSQTGWGNYFDGTGDYLTTNATQAIPATGDFTIEAWVYPTVSGPGRNIVSQGTSGASGRLQLNVHTDNTLQFAITSTLVYSTGTVTPNQWNYVAVTRTGSSVAFYINGSAAGTATLSGTVQNTTLAIGSEWSGDPYRWLGYISNVRISNVVRTITAAPTAPFTSDANTVVLTCQSNRFIDASSNAYTITRNGDVSVQAFSPFNPTAAWSAATNGGSGYFDGSGDFLSTTTNIAAIGTGDFTLEVWCYPTATTSYRYFLAIGPDTNFATGLSTGGYAPYLYSSGFIITSSISTVPNAWNHVQYVRSSGTLTVYVNGVSGGSVSWTGSIAAGRGYIGANDSNLYYFVGYHSSLRFSNIARSVSVPTAPYTSDANTQLLLNYTNAGIFDATSKNDLETVGNAQISTTQSKFGGSSMYFDGTGDWLAIPATQNIVFGTADFTIEMWVYSGAQSGTSVRMMGNGAGGSWASGKYILTTTTAANPNKFTFAVNNTTPVDLLVSTTTFNDSTWRHVAITRYGNVFRLFVNGIQESTNTSSASVDNGTAVQIRIGSGGISGDADWAGYIDDLRITKGIARYTSNFTVPTTAFPVQ